MRMATMTKRAGWPALLALALIAGPALAQDAGDGAVTDQVAVGEGTIDGGAIDGGTVDGGVVDGGVVGDDGVLIDPILHTSDLPAPTDGSDVVQDLAPGEGDGATPDDGLPVDSACGGCEYQTMGGVQNDAGPLALPLRAGRSHRGHDVAVARAGRENLCTSRENYVAWLCEWQGFARP